MDDLIGQAMHAAPDGAFLITADHGMNAKTLCWDLEKVCERRGVPLRKAFSVGRVGTCGSIEVAAGAPTCISRIRKIQRTTSSPTISTWRDGCIKAEMKHLSAVPLQSPARRRSRSHLR
jgi:hypothetical protein